MAIALLPLKEGETLGSNFGRYAELMGLKSTRNLRRSLFGCASSQSARLPTAIGYLAEQTCDYLNMKAEDIVKEHTEFRYATMMAPQSIREKVLQGMLASPARGIMPLKIWGLKGERTATLRYCEGCLAEWIEKQQTPYWRIDHQLAGVYCCVKHSCILKSVKRVRSERYFDQTVLRLIHASDERVLQRVTLSEKRAIEDIAKRSGQQRAEGSVCKSAKTYRDLVREAGFVGSDCRMKHEAIISAWFDYFGQEYCHVTNMTAGRVSSWLDRLSERTFSSECRHPFMFIAGASFFEHHVELPGSYLPQIRCKAPNFEREREMAVPVLQAYSCKGGVHRGADVPKFASLRTGGWKLVCTCGISYRVVAATRCDVVRLIPLSYGPRYRKRLRALIAKGSSVERAAQEMHLNTTTAYKWARSDGVANSEMLSQGEVRKLRATWRRLVQNAPSTRRITAAAEADPAVHRALSENDRDWLLTFNRSHRSPRRSKGSYRLNEPTSDQIREACRGLILAEPPIMATRCAILERAGCRRDWDRSRPFTTVLAELVECRPAYLERVISWLASLALGQRLGDCDETIRTAGLRRRSFNREQQERIREIESMDSVGGHSTCKC